MTRDVDDDADYKVGRGKPPKHTRFRPGQSGNPRGRPKESKNWETLFDGALRERVAVTEGGKRRRLTKVEVAIRQLVNKAAAGDIRSLELVLKHIATRPAGPSDQLVAPVFGSPEDDQQLTDLLEQLGIAGRRQMSPQRQRQFETLLKEHFCSFARKVFQTLNPGTPYTPGWHIDVIAEWLTAFREGTGHRMIVNLPPRHLKSLLGSIALPAWLLGHNPSLQIICASYSGEFANKPSRDTRTVMESPWYRALFPRTRLVRSAAHELTTTAHGCRMATSVDGVLTGRGADLIIIDDPLKPDEALSDTQRVHVNEWFDGTLFSRLNDKQNGNILLIMQRLHEDDLTGHLVGKGGWDQLVMAAIAEQDERYGLPSRKTETWVGRKAGEALHPARESLETLHTIRQTIGEYNFAGQYQQRPAPRDGGMVKRAWFKSYTEAERPERFGLVLQSWDTANKTTELSDYSVCTTWGVDGQHLYLLDVFRGKLEFPELKRAVRERATLHGAATVLIEDKASGTRLIQELVYEGMHEVKAYKPDAGMDKRMRMYAQTATLENGFVHVPNKAEWLDRYLLEMTTFPNARHDDQVDSTAQALHWFKTGRKPEPGLITYYARLVRQQQEQEAADNALVAQTHTFSHW